MSSHTNSGGALPDKLIGEIRMQLDGVSKIPLRNASGRWLCSRRLEPHRPANGVPNVESTTSTNWRSLNVVVDKLSELSEICHTLRHAG